MTQATEMKHATPAHLHDGTWGVRVQSEDVKEGEAVQVTSSSGKTWEATVSRVVWHGDGVAVCGTVKGDKQRAEAGESGKPAPAATEDAGGDVPF